MNKNYIALYQGRVSLDALRGWCHLEANGTVEEALAYQRRCLEEDMSDPIKSAFYYDGHGNFWSYRVKGTDIELKERWRVGRFVKEVFSDFENVNGLTRVGDFEAEKLDFGDIYAVAVPCEYWDAEAEMISTDTVCVFMTAVDTDRGYSIIANIEDAVEGVGVCMMESIVYKE